MNPGASALLSVSSVHIAYGKVEAVRSVSLDVAGNEIVTIIGANGAGKTTLLNAIMGILPLKGRVTFAGQDLLRLEIEDRVAAGLSLVPEHRELFGTMNVEDNLQLGAFRMGPEGRLNHGHATSRVPQIDLQRCQRRGGFEQVRVQGQRSLQQRNGFAPLPRVDQRCRLRREHIGVGLFRSGHAIQ